MSTINWLMLFREKSLFIVKNHVEHINTFCGQSVELLKLVVHIVTTCFTVQSDSSALAAIWPRSPFKGRRWV